MNRNTTGAPNKKMVQGPGMAQIEEAIRYGLPDELVSTYQRATTHLSQLLLAGRDAG